MRNKWCSFFGRAWIIGMIILWPLKNSMASSYPFNLSAGRALEISDEIATRVLEKFDHSRHAEIFGGGYVLLDYRKSIEQEAAAEEPVFVITYEHKDGQADGCPPAEFLVFVYCETGAAKVVMN